MTRREFINTMNAGITGLALGMSGRSRAEEQPQPLKNWAWMIPNRRMSDDDYKALFALMNDCGIHAILPEIYNGHNAYYNSTSHPVEYDWLGQILPLAKAAGLEVHGWMWSMPCNDPAIRAQHPDWFAVNGLGESAGEKPAYVNYYRFLCPNRAGAQEFIQTTVREIAAISEIDGIHLDYIRFPDVILAEALQPKYNIVQDREYPQYDYCYCQVCREKFKSQTGIDPLDMSDPGQNQEWIQFRYDSINNLVKNILAPEARKKNKKVTAAVFPNWQMVRQQWSTWQLDAVLPMLYNSFYNAGPAWIQEHTQKGKASLSPQTRLHSGLFVPGMSPDDLTNAIKAAWAGNADGYALFNAGSLNDEHWKAIKKLNSEIKG